MTEVLSTLLVHLIPVNQIKLINLNLNKLYLNYLYCIIYGLEKVRIAYWLFSRRHRQERAQTGPDIHTSHTHLHFGIII